MKKIMFFDTTLRDGEQTVGVNLNIKAKLKIARELEKMGIDCIEAGFPAASEGDFEAVKAVSEQVENCEVAALSRCNKGDIDKAWEALKGAKKPRIHLFIATSDIHIEHKLKTTKEQVIQKIKECVSYAKSLCENIEFSAEDASRSNKEFLCKAVQTAIDNGANVINLPDTVGYSEPLEYGELIKYVSTNVKGMENTIISVHCHNDLGLAVANSLSAVKNGALQIEGTINGIGERAGNAALEEIIMALTVRKDIYGVTHNIDTTRLTGISRAVSAITGVNIQQHKPIVGANAFSHESGIHQHGVLEDRRTYEIIKPETVGLNANTIVLGKLSGRHAFEDKLSAMGYTAEKEVIDKAFTMFKEVADRKNEISDDDIAAIIQETMDACYTDGSYELCDFSIQSTSRMKGSAMVTLKRNGQSMSEAAVGEGPIDASFNAINRLTDKNIKLARYNIKAVTEGTDALGEVVVKVKVDGQSYVGRGVSTDIIEASVKAYVNALNRCEHNIHNPKKSY